MVTTDELHKEIDLIQSCISRMTNNSFMLKGWLVSLMVVIITLTPENSNQVMAGLVMLTLTLAFWYLDGFFLRTEKLYREMYNWMLEKRREGSKEAQYDLNPERFDSQVGSIRKVMWSKTLRWFYLIICLLILLFLVNAFCFCRG